MPILKDIITDLRDFIGSMFITTGDGEVVDIKSVMWNNQLERVKAGELTLPRYPCVYLEVLPQQWQTLGMTYLAADVTFRVHLIHQEFDAMDGTQDQNMNVYDLRKRLMQWFALYKTLGCGRMVPVNEEQDYNHDNLYHYIIDFKAHVIESTIFANTGSSGSFIVKEPPTDLDLTVEKQH